MSGRYGSTRARAPRPARWMDLKFAGKCCQCGSVMPADSRGFYDPSDRTVTCTAMACCEASGLTEEVWLGSPTSGGYVTSRSATRLVTSRFSSGELVHRNARGRCEDAPCCGCCT